MFIAHHLQTSVCLASNSFPTPASVVWVVSCCCPAPPRGGRVGRALSPCLPQRPGVLCLGRGVSLRPLSLAPVLWEASATPKGWGGDGNGYCSRDSFMAQGETLIWVFNRTDYLYHITVSQHHTALTRNCYKIWVTMALHYCVSGCISQKISD